MFRFGGKRGRSETGSYLCPFFYLNCPWWSEPRVLLWCEDVQIRGRTKTCRGSGSVHPLPVLQPSPNKHIHGLREIHINQIATSTDLHHFQSLHHHRSATQSKNLEPVMSTDFKSIPLIDISPLLAKWDDPNMAKDQGVAEVVRQLDQACREAGFFYVKGHGIPDSLIKEVRNVTHRFFSLPNEEKLKIKISPAAGYRGYQRIGKNITKGIPDMHEAIDCYREVKPGMYGALSKPLEGPNQWPINPPNLKQVIEEYLRLCTDLSRKIMRGIALALGASSDEFEGKIAGDPFWVLRIIGYPGASFANGQGMAEHDVGCGAHTDYGLLTLVNQDDDITALQVRNVSGEWISAPPLPGAFVCNIGDMLKILSNGIYESTLHRVINSSPKYRVSVAYFYETNFDAAIEPVDICIRKTGGTKKFERAVYGEHLVSKVQTNFVKDELES